MSSPEPSQTNKVATDSSSSSSSSSQPEASKPHLTSIEKWFEKLNGLNLNSDQMAVILMEKQNEKTRLLEDLQSQTLKRTKEIKWLNTKLEYVDKKRKHSRVEIADIKDTIKKVKSEKPLVKEIACDDALVNILEFLPGLQGFSLLLVSKQFLRVVNRLKSYYPVEDDDPVTFSDSRIFKGLQKFKQSESTEEEELKYILRRGDSLLDVYLILSCDFSAKMFSQKSRIEKLTIQEGDDDPVKLKLDAFNLYNLTELTLFNMFEISNAPAFINNTTQSLRVLHIEADSITSSLEVISSLPHLEELSLETVIVSAETKLFDIFKCKSLVKCELFCSANSEELNDPPLIYLEVPQLETLFLKSTHNICDVVCNFEMPKLTTLELSGVTRRGAGYLSLNETLTNLSKLEFFSPKDESHQLVLQNHHLKSLKTLNIRTQSDNDSLSGLLFHLSNQDSPFNLEKVVVERKKCSLDGFEQFCASTKFNNLTELDIGMPSLVKQLLFLAETKSFPNLKKLHLGNRQPLESNEIEEVKSLQFISQLSRNEHFKNLTSLKYYISDKDVYCLKSSSALKLMELIIIKSNLLTSRGYKQLCDWGVTWTTCSINN